MARVVLAEAGFCIFDEPTAHLDPAGAGELLVDSPSSAVTHRRGVLVITHERTGLEDFDQVVELKNGLLADAAPPIGG